MNISPSLRKFNERYYLSGKYISDKQLQDLLLEVEKVNKGQNITFHEFICACFFLAASRNNSDINILESGLFFRLDASNVLEKNIASIIMPIGIDHKDFLKDGTIGEIVYEKCSHLLGRSNIFISNQKKNVLGKIKKCIFNNSSNKIIFGENYTYKKNNKGFIFTDELGKINLPMPNLLGNFQIFYNYILRINNNYHYFHRYDHPFYVHNHKERPFLHHQRIFSNILQILELHYLHDLS
jgi:dihydrofolate synthase/folylpolyglutamate synthase